MDKKISSDSDSSWKTMLEKYLQWVLEFLFPNVAREINWTKPVIHLDKELLKIQKKTKVGKRIADKLIQVYKNNGEITFIVIHIEIQGKKEKNFQERLFQYYYKIYDRYKLPIITLAILTDSNRHWRPSEYNQEIMGCHLKFKFQMVKLLDFMNKQDILAKSKNPMAKIVEAHLMALISRKSVSLKLENKLKLVKNLYTLGYTREVIRDIYEFIDRTISLPTDLEEEFVEEMQEFEEEKHMPYICSIERVGERRGIKQGREQGKEQGIDLGSRNMFLFILESKYFASAVPENIAKRVQNATLEELKLWLKAILAGKFEVAELEA